MDLVLKDGQGEFAMQECEQGYWAVELEGMGAGTRYMFRRQDGTERPDPASRSQPEGVHGPSEVVDHAQFSWTDTAWRGLPMERMIIYELHVGTFTNNGTFQGVMDRLAELVDLGITAVELMPVAQFPGERNWGYDGAYPFSTQHSYGGPQGLKRLVNACHEMGLAVILDVVYNHLGPEGNYLNDFGPYFTEKYKTPWGAALNFDDAHSDHVRHFFIQNALMWLRDFHIDGLRLDAVHAILDTGAKHLLRELNEHVSSLAQHIGRTLVLIAESDQSDRRLLDPYDKGGYGLDAQWLDDLHHAIHTLLTGETDGYYEDYGGPEHLVKALKHSFVHNGTYSTYRKRTVGSDATDIPARQFVVCIQNHDQVGNRMLGERLTQLVPWDMLKVAAGLYLLSPYTPLIWMGEEYGAEEPFLYFVSHSDAHLLEAVRKGRREEFAGFGWKEEPPDPGDPRTFERSKLQHNWPQDERRRQLRDFYRTLIGLRKNEPALVTSGKQHLLVRTTHEGMVLHLVHTGMHPHLYTLFNLTHQAQEVELLTDPAQRWGILLDSATDGKTSIRIDDRMIMAPASLIVLRETQVP
jgi:maltooligosyltrehalose trehalohydrolase